jgi:hypothetical protein
MQGPGAGGGDLPGFRCLEVLQLSGYKGRRGVLDLSTCPALKKAVLDDRMSELHVVGLSKDCRLLEWNAKWCPEWEEWDEYLANALPVLDCPRDLGGLLQSNSLVHGTSSLGDRNWLGKGCTYS